MTQGDKNKLLLILLTLLVLTSIGLAVIGNSGPKKRWNTGKYAVKDTASITKITLQSEYYGLENELTRTKEGWKINQTYAADPNMIQVLLAVLNQVSVRRPVPLIQTKDIRKAMAEKGIRATMYRNNKIVNSFMVTGNSTKTLSYMAENADSRAYVVELPGYESYVAGIFEVPELDWRNRMVFNSTWRSLQRLELLYPDFSDQNVEIRFTMDFFEVTGIEKLDTAFMMDFIDHFQAFQCNRFIDPIPGGPYDSLLKNEPLVIIALEDIDVKKSNRVVLYPPLSGAGEYPGRLSNEQVVLFDAATIRSVLRKKYEFNYKGSL